MRLDDILNSISKDYKNPNTKQPVKAITPEKKVVEPVNTIQRVQIEEAVGEELKIKEEAISTEINKAVGESGTSVFIAGESGTRPHSYAVGERPHQYKQSLSAVGELATLTSQGRESVCKRLFTGRVKAEELEISVYGSLGIVKIRGKGNWSKVFLRQILSLHGIKILSKIRRSLRPEGGAVECMQGLETDYYLLPVEDKEFIYKVINFMDIEFNNKYIEEVMRKIRSEYEQDINRLNILRGSLEAGHTNSEILDEIVKLTERLAKRGVITTQFARASIKNLSLLFLKNLKMDKKAHSISNQNQQQSHQSLGAGLPFVRRYGRR